MYFSKDRILKEARFKSEEKKVQFGEYCKSTATIHEWYLRIMNSTFFHYCVDFRNEKSAASRRLMLSCLEKFVNKAIYSLYLFFEVIKANSYAV